MKRRLIITDLTRFSDKDNRVCMAGIDVLTNECIRPMPYLTKERCSKEDILPGSILEGYFEPNQKFVAPHTEDYFQKDMKKSGACSSEEFLKVLNNSNVGSIVKGFGVPLIPMKNCISHEYASNIKASIITIELAPSALHLVSTQYMDGEIKVKVHIKDSVGLCLHNLPLADLGYFNYIKTQQNIDKVLEAENEFIGKQEKVFLRVGIGRVFAIKEHNGYWLQVNGIYTFPRFNKEIRSYT